MVISKPELFIIAKSKTKVVKCFDKKGYPKFDNTYLTTNNCLHSYVCFLADVKQT